MFLLNFIPDFVFHVILLLGLVGIIASILIKYVPAFSIHSLPLRILGLVLLLIGVWYEGGISSRAEIKTKLEKLENELILAKKESNKVTKEIVTKVVVEKQVIKEKGKTIKEYIDREVTIYDETCPLPSSVIKAHNAAALNQTELLKNINADTMLDVKLINEAANPTIKLAPKK